MNWTYTGELDLYGGIRLILGNYTHPGTHQGALDSCEGMGLLWGNWTYIGTHTMELDSCIRVRALLSQTLKIQGFRS